MSLLDDLRDLDVSAIVNARGSITAAVQKPELQSLITSGAASSALGGLGSSLDSLRGSLSNPEAMLRPILDTIGGLSVHFDSSSLPLGDFGDAVREGMDFIMRLVSSISGDAANFGEIFGTPLAEAVRIAGDRAGVITGALGQSADTFADLSRLVSQDIRDSTALIDLVIDVLLPFPKTQLRSVRDGIGGLVTASLDLHLPSGRTSGLVAALDAVAAAAATGNAAALDAALRTLQQVRQNTLGVLRDDQLFVVSQLQRLRVPQILAPLADFGNTLRMGEQGVIEFLADFRDMVRAVREQVDNPDFTTVRVFLASIVPIIEERAHLIIEVPIDQAVEAAKDFVRRTLRQIPIRDLRNQLTKFLHDAATSINNANLDGPAESVRNALSSVQQALDPSAITGQVRAALDKVHEAISGALDGVIEALNIVQQRVDELAGQAEAILGRVADALTAFQQAIDGIATAIDNLGIEQIEQQLVEKLTSLREAASDLLSNVPIPEPLRPQIEQLISLLEGVDFDQVFEPVQNAVAELRIPNDVSATVTEGLAEAKRVIENLIPAQLIASIQEEVNHALDTIRNFNPASLLPDISQYLGEAAQLVEQLDPRALAEQIRGPFQAVLDIVDRVHPDRLLAPVIQAYDALLSDIPAPDPQAAATGLVTGLQGAGRLVGRAVVEPARRMTGGDNAEIADPESQQPTADLPPPRSDVHAGDAIRLLGYIPARVRQLLQSIEAGPAGQVLAEVDQLCGGLARQIRQVQAALYEVGRRLDTNFEEFLIPLGPAQFRAQLAIQASFGSAVHFQASLDAVALAGPASIRRELAETVAAVRATAQEMAGAAGGNVGASLERTAVALESSPMANFAGDLDGFLAALDPEPIAAEMDALVDRIIALTPQLVSELLADMRTFVTRLQAVIAHYNPGAQAQKFLAVLDVLREELDVLNPRRLAAELVELHGAIRATIAAYDPRALAEEFAATTRAIAQSIRSLNPQDLLGDISFLQETVDRVAQANPADRLADVGAALTEVSERLAEINLDHLIASVNQLGPRLETAFEQLIEAVRAEIVTLLQSLRFASGSASASVSASVSVE